MELIRQQTDDQCAIAGIAMVTGLDYDYVLKMGLLTRYYISPGGTHTGPLLTTLGVTYKALYDYNNRITNSFWKEILWGRRALISVDSLNKEDRKHIIAWNYNEILDPQNGNEDRLFFTEISNDMKIDTVYLLCECGPCGVKPQWKVEKASE